LPKEGIKTGIANAILIKLNQIGTVSETPERGFAGISTVFSGRISG